MNVAAARRLLVLPRPTTWQLFVVLLVATLGSEYWDKDPVTFVAGLQLPWPRFMAVVLLLPLIVPPRDWRWSAVTRLPAHLRPMIVFWLACAVSVVAIPFAPGRSTVGEFLKTFFHLSVYIVFVCVLVKWATPQRVSLLVKVYYGLGAAAAVLSILQWVHGTLGLFEFLAPLRFQSGEYDVGVGLTTGFRAASSFGEPSWAARYYVHFIALALAFWFRTGARRHLVVLVLCLVAFYAANSLLGYVIFVAFAIVGLLAQAWSRSTFSLSRRQKIGLVATAAVCLLIWLSGAAPRLPDLMDRSVARVGLVLQGGGGAGNRIDSVFAGLEVWKLAPILGVGLGNIDAYIVDFYLDPAWVLRSRFASDSLYVQILAETGIFGLTAFLWFWFRLLWFSAPGDYGSRPGVQGDLYTWMRFLQLDLFAQAVGMANASDYLNPHLWTVIAMVLACKTVLLAEGRTAALNEAVP
ncbi:MAG: O-antigen ligase family protein [Vicinamibacterales bacterium]